MIETIIQNATSSQLQLTCTQGFLHAGIDQEKSAEPPEVSELREETKSGNCTKRCVGIAKHRNCGTNI